MFTGVLESECDSIHCLTTGYTPISSTESIPVILSLIVILGRKRASWIEFHGAGPQSQHTVTPRILPLPPHIHHTPDCDSLCGLVCVWRADDASLCPRVHFRVCLLCSADVSLLAPTTLLILHPFFLSLPFPQLSHFLLSLLRTPLIPLPVSPLLCFFISLSLDKQFTSQHSTPLPSCLHGPNMVANLYLHRHLQHQL